MTEKEEYYNSYYFKDNMKFIRSQSQKTYEGAILEIKAILFQLNNDFKNDFPNPQEIKAMRWVAFETADKIDFLKAFIDNFGASQKDTITALVKEALLLSKTFALYESFWNIKNKDYGEGTPANLTISKMLLKLSQLINDDIKPLE